MRFFGSLFTLAILSLILVNPALAENVAEASGGIDIKSLAAGLTIAIAAFGGTFSQGRVGAAALDGISRNPGASGSLFTPMLLILVFIESLVILSLLIALKLAGFL